MSFFFRINIPTKYKIEILAMKNSIIRRLSVFVIALSLYLSFKDLKKLPENVATHFNLQGVADGFTQIGDYRLVMTYLFMACAAFIFAGAFLSIFRRGKNIRLVNYLYTQGAAFSVWIFVSNYVLVKSNEIAGNIKFCSGGILMLSAGVFVLILPMLYCEIFVISKYKKSLRAVENKDSNS